MKQIIGCSSKSFGIMCIDCNRCAGSSECNDFVKEMGLEFDTQE